MSARSGWAVRLARPLSFGFARRTVLLTSVALAATAFGASAASASAQEYHPSASAYGTQVNVAGTVTSGRSAAVAIGGGCSSAIGVSKSNTVGSVSTSVLSTGTINTTAASETTGTGLAATSSATTQGVSILGGLVSATEVESVSTTSDDTSTNAFATSAAGTTFTSLTVAGTSISETPAPNTTITLPGVGYVVLNQQTSHIGTKSANLTVIGIHVVVDESTPLAPFGTQVWVSVAKSSLAGPLEGLLNGLAFGTSANVGNTVIAGQSFPEGMPCPGTGGVTKSNTGVGVTIPDVLTSGTIDDTANGKTSPTQDSGEMTSTVEGLNLLSGAVTATTVEADVTASGNPPTLGDNSSFVGLSVAGHPEITDSVPPNTKVSLPGIGTLWLHRQIETARSIRVIMIQLIIGKNSSTGLPVGAVINVGYARVGVS